MKKIFVGIDISKEKLNLCCRSGLDIVREEECARRLFSFPAAGDETFLLELPYKYGAAVYLNKDTA